jgi:DNA-binding PadR family transcriptional regulator
MHPYEIGATLKMRRMEKSIKFRYGSLYTVIEGLQKKGWIAAKETVRDGRRPERTIYEITPGGLERMRTWLREMLGTPVKEYPQFEAALSFLPAIPPADAVTLLEGRLRRLGAIAEEIRAVIEVVSKSVEALFLVENEYRLAMIEAERQFIDGLLRRIADDEGYTRAWKGFHKAGHERDSSPS